MTKPAFDYRSLSVDERLQLVGDIWDSIAEEAHTRPEVRPLPMAPPTGYCGIDFAGRRTGSEIRGTTLIRNSTDGGWGSAEAPGCEPAGVPDSIVLRRQ